MNEKSDSLLGPQRKTTRREIVYKKSKWRVHQFKIFSGEVLCTVAVLQMDSSVMLWIGKGRSSEFMLNEISLAMPCCESSDKATGASGLVSTLLGAEGLTSEMARRLSVLMKRPVYLCSGSEFDKFTVPLVERGLVAEIKSRPDCF